MLGIEAQGGIRRWQIREAAILLGEAERAYRLEGPTMVSDGRKSYHSYIDLTNLFKPTCARLAFLASSTLPYFVELAAVQQLKLAWDEV